MLDDDEVDYGRPPRAGIWAGGVEQLDTPFARLALAPYNRGDLGAVYRCYGCDGSLLYVGVTNGPLRRFREHAAASEWWGEVDHVLVVPFGDRRGAEYHERLIIRYEHPIYNVVGVRH